MDQDILIRNGFIEVPAVLATDTLTEVDIGVATVLANLARYGYTVDRAAFAALRGMEQLGAWWRAVETILKAVTGANRRMADFVVYKNFPREVLDMDVATAVTRQILIYFGMPYEWLREVERPRPPLGEVQKLKVLTLADGATEGKIFADLMALPNRWSDNQIVWAKKLIGSRNAIVMSEFAFKENGIQLAADNFERMEFAPSSGTDVLRLCAVLSKGDVSLRETVRLRKFVRPERRRLLAALDGQSNLGEDMASRPEMWKRLLERLHPGDYGDEFAHVRRLYDDLYNKRLKPFSAKVDPPAAKVTPAMLDVVATRPGEFLRRFHHYYDLFGVATVDRLLTVMDKLSTRQLLGLRGYLRTINDRTWLIYPPKSNWARAQVVSNTKSKIDPEHRRRIDVGISQVLAARLAAAFPDGMNVDMTVDQVRFQTNDQRLAEYGRGTEFDIPAHITFVRSASFWARDRTGVTWYDNGWNFFDENWNARGTCAWNNQLFNRSGQKEYWSALGNPLPADRKKNYAAIFSGDPVNIRDLKGRACQMADLYLDRLVAFGIRYAVWNVLCYSKQKFSEAEEVLATLQLGENAEEGNLYEPSRAQMVFPLKSESYASYVAYIDLKRRKLVYMDVGFRANVSNAGTNSERLTQIMPAYVEYLDALPTVLELVQDAPATLDLLPGAASGAVPVLYSDANIPIRGGRAFVFRPENKTNTYERVSVADLLSV